MSTLQEFLNTNPVDNLTDEVAISPRFGSLKFKIKAMTNREFDDVRKRATRISKGRKVDFDAQSFNTAVIINHTLEPDFKDAESIKKLGCTTPEEYLSRVLLAGEIATLANAIQKLSGFDVEMEELVEEVKN